MLLKLKDRNFEQMKKQKIPELSCGVCDAFGWQDLREKNLMQDNQKHLKVKLKLKVDLMLEKNLKMKESLK